MSCNLAAQESWVWIVTQTMLPVHAELLTPCHVLNSFVFSTVITFQIIVLAVLCPITGLCCQILVILQAQGRVMKEVLLFFQVWSDRGSE